MHWKLYKSVDVNSDPFIIFIVIIDLSPYMFLPQLVTLSITVSCPECQSCDLKFYLLSLYIEKARVHLWMQICHHVLLLQVADWCGYGHSVSFYTLRIKEMTNALLNLVDSAVLNTQRAFLPFVFNDSVMFLWLFYSVTLGGTTGTE